MPRKTLKEIRERWNAESPEFFKKITNAGMLITVIGGILCFFPPLIPIGGTIGLIGSSIGTVSKLTKKDQTPEERLIELEKLKSEIEILKSKMN